MAVKINSINRLLRHYDKVIAIIALCCLSVSLYYLTSAGSARKRHEVLYINQLDNLKPVSPDLGDLDLAGYQHAAESLTNPLQIGLPDPLKPGFLTPERRVTCIRGSCQKPIAYAAKVCPFCEMEQPVPPESDPDLDTDGDGIPDRWEIKYGLNPADSSDAHTDLDGDGFTNLEEYQAGTDPKDPKSHPALIDFLYVKELLGKRMPLAFSGVNKMPDGKLQLVFNQSHPVKRTFWVRQGEPVGDSGWVSTEKVEIKFEERPDPTMPGGKRRVDVSTVEVKRLADNKIVTLKIGESGDDTDIEAVLTLPRMNTEYKVLEGGTFKISEEVFKLVAIDTEKTTVTVENEATGLQKVIRKLD